MWSTFVQRSEAHFGKVAEGFVLTSMEDPGVEGCSSSS